MSSADNNAPARRRRIARRYDSDLVEESVVVKWYNQASQKDDAGRKVREAAAPFIEWLAKAEEESSADEANTPAARTGEAEEEQGALPYAS